MKIKFYLLTLLILTLTFNACNKSDDNGDTPIDPDENRAEQQVIDNDSLVGYLETHYYNSGDLAGIIDPTIDDIIISELADGETVPANHTLLMTDVETKETVYRDYDYKYYVLTLNEGGGDSPHFCDSALLNYSGNLQDESIFDSTVNAENAFDLLGLIPGWSKVIPQFKSSTSHIDNGDGTVTYSGYGIGVMFLPSGLGYYSNSLDDIPIYSNLIFKFELYQTEVNDHDNDGVPSYIEDLDGDLDLNDEDTDEDLFSNYFDNDDDADGVITLNELVPKEYEINVGDPDPVFAAREYERSRSEEGGIITIKTVTIVDADNNGIDDYLDKDVTTNYNE